MHNIWLEYSAGPTKAPRSVPYNQQTSTATAPALAATTPPTIARTSSSPATTQTTSKLLIDLGSIDTQQHEASPTATDQDPTLVDEPISHEQAIATHWETCLRRHLFQIALALATLARNEVVHRNLHPEACLLDTKASQMLYDLVTNRRSRSTLIGHRTHILINSRARIERHQARRLWNVLCHTTWSRGRLSNRNAELHGTRDDCQCGTWYHLWLQGMEAHLWPSNR